MDMQAIQDLIARRLRRKCPFMKCAALARAVKNAASSLEEDIAKEASAMAESKASFDFFSLPAEIRNQIYEFVLDVEREEIEFDTWGYAIEPPWDFWRDHAKRTGGALRMVSRQTRTEARAVYYAHTTFVLDFYWLGSRYLNVEEMVKSWTEVMGPQAQLLKRMILRFEGYNMYAHLANYVRLHQSSEEPTPSPTLKQGPARPITRETIMSLPPFNAMGILPSIVVVELKDLKADTWETLSTDDEVKAAIDAAS